MGEARSVVIVIDDGFPLISYASILSVLRATNDAGRRETFRWRTVSATGGGVRSDCGVDIESERADPSGSARRAGGTDRIVVLLSNIRPEDQRKSLLAWIRESLSRGARVLSVGAGTELLCEAGVLNGRRCAVHWSDFGAAVEKYPRVVMSRAFFEIDGPFFTCAGALTTFDVMMLLIAAEVSAEVLDRVSAHLLQATPRGLSERQSIPDQVRLERLNSPLLRVVDLMEESIVDPVPVEDLFRSARISRRQAERLFDKHMGISPKRFYMRLRLERARDLLRHTPMQVAEVAAATGFVSHSHFSKSFKAVFGLLPAAMRRSEVKDAEGPQSTATNDNVGWSRSDRGEAFGFARRHSRQSRFISDAGR